MLAIPHIELLSEEGLLFEDKANIRRGFTGSLINFTFFEIIVN